MIAHIAAIKRIVADDVINDTDSDKFLFVEDFSLLAVANVGSGAIRLNPINNRIKQFRHAEEFQ